MTEIIIDADIILQMQLDAISRATNIPREQLVVLALEKFLCTEGYNNPNVVKDSAAA